MQNFPAVRVYLMVSVLLGAAHVVAPASSPADAALPAPPPPPGEVEPTSAPERATMLAPPPVSPEASPEDDMVGIRHRGGHSTENANAEARWSRIRATSSCWYFSGPSPLGRDHDHGHGARMVVEGDDVSLTFGTATFRGRLGHDGRVRLRRGAAKANDGWRYVETLSGRLDEGVLTAAYRYRECSLGGQGRCQLGSGSSDYCRITARVQVQASGSPNAVIR